MKLLLLASFLAMSSILAAQGPDFGDHHQPDGPPPMRPITGPMGRAMHTGRWWSDPHVAQDLGLSADQQRRMDDLFQAHRLKLIDLSASLQKEEAIMEPLLESDRPEESKILVQIDRIAQARAELEKANARLLLGLRGVLTQEQWKKLETDREHGRVGARQQDRGAGAPLDHPADGPPRPH
jgi:Spy/CpxP family protein refolding chaperone